MILRTLSGTSSYDRFRIKWGSVWNYVGKNDGHCVIWLTYSDITLARSQYIKRLVPTLEKDIKNEQHP